MHLKTSATEAIDFRACGLKKNVDVHKSCSIKVSASLNGVTNVGSAVALQLSDVLKLLHDAS